MNKRTAMGNGYVYLMKSDRPCEYKVGITVDIERRKTELKSNYHGRKMTCMEVTNIGQDVFAQTEKMFHHLYKDCAVNDDTSATELFNFANDSEARFAYRNVISAVRLMQNNKELYATARESAMSTVDAKVAEIRRECNNKVAKNKSVCIKASKLIKQKCDMEVAEAMRALKDRESTMSKTYAEVTSSRLQELEHENKVFLENMRNTCASDIEEEYKNKNLIVKIIRYILQTITGVKEVIANYKECR